MIYLQKRKGPTCILVNQKKKKKKKKTYNTSPKCFFIGRCVFCSALTPALNKLNLFIFRVESHIFVHVTFFWIILCFIDIYGSPWLAVLWRPSSPHTVPCPFPGSHSEPNTCGNVLWHRECHHPKQGPWAQGALATNGKSGICTSLPLSHQQLLISGRQAWQNSSFAMCFNPEWIK